jgi:hypothetical protein
VTRAATATVSVDRGHPDDDELAAVLAVLLSARRCDTAPAASRNPSGWTAPGAVADECEGWSWPALPSTYGQVRVS